VIASVAVVNPGLVGYVAVPMGAVALAGAVAGLVIYLRGDRTRGESQSVQLTNPFELSSALKFGLVFAAILFITKIATTFGRSGIYIASLVAGTTDVDAITLSMANLVKDGSVAATVAATAILLATAANTVVKTGMALWMGGPGFRGKVAASFAVMILFGGAGAAALWLRA